MQKDENTPGMETTDDIIVRKLTDENTSLAFVKEYLQSEFVSSAIDQLFYIRRQAGLTQAQVAERLNTKQAAIARIEADTDGSMSFRRYVEFALECGMVPLDITFVPIEAARNFVIANPDLPLTQMNYHTWLLARELQTLLLSQDVQPTLVPNQPSVATATTVRTSSSRMIYTEEFRG